MAANAPLKYPESSRGLNHFEFDRNLQRYLERVYPDFLTEHEDMLEDYADYASGELDEQAEYSDFEGEPYIKQRLDRAVKPDHRINDVILNRRYKDAQQEIYKRGLMAKAFEGSDPSPHMLTFLAQYMTSYTDISTGCPLAMTHPITILLANGDIDQDLRDKFLPQMLRTDGNTPVGGTWATEKHSGSDVPGTTTEAVKQADGSYHLNGHQWFASAMGFDRWLTIKTAQTDDGLGLFLVPKYLDEDWDEDELSEENPVHVTYLKDKQGTKGLATAEIELNDTVAYMVADGKSGLRVMMEALGCSRVHNAMAAAGVMHRAYVEAMCWVSHRETFDKKLIEREGIQAELLNLKVAWAGGSALAFEAARSFDNAIQDPSSAAWLRVATALAKYRTAETALESTATAMELVGGLGYTVDHPIERIHRDAMVLRVWEGPKHIQAKELMSMLKRGGAEAFLERMDDILDGLPKTLMDEEHDKLKVIRDDIETALGELAQAPEKFDVSAYRFMDSMATALTYALLCEEAGHELLIHEDQTKMLIAQSYYEDKYKQGSTISLEYSGLHKHFNDVSQGMAVPLTAAQKAKLPAPSA